MPALCRDCFGTGMAEEAPACPACGSRRLARHRELFTLVVAHVDCDAFYASVEKRDRPELAAKPVIVGGGRRGVVAACCYIARTTGVRSAMPMFKALRLCPDAVVIRPEMAKYAAAARQVRALMERLTPLVQPLSIDEAVLDLRGTEALHRAPPAVMLARFARSVEQEVGVTVSIGLAPNRLLAKLAAERDKPRGFAVLGAAEARDWLAPQPVTLLPGIGPALARRLEAAGFATLGQLAALDARDAARRFGEEGPGLAARARGEDARAVTPEREAKSISAETTFDADLREIAALEAPLWRMCEKLARRLREKDLAAGGIVLKLKTAGFALRTRNARLPAPTRLPETLFAAARPLLAKEADGTAFRLIGIGAQPLAPAEDADRGDLADPLAPKRAARWQAVEALRAKYGDAAVALGRGLKPRR
ncbi:DNA polymerase IV [Paracraurococcus ruber]|uniref:DNA polymerase IV n=1 Tax=Paracraurococcus ruber TaxID=77675 RepID=A0ABS1CTK8_9PROT|nr:DNA polymerase IV [Paracraurococcus ruber]MBK1657678.1 DNA polymerase IV [Paracraurococcus ruber]TDG31518.1 DNA polymerase IV [Paracraurococcus ruber]